METFLAIASRRDERRYRPEPLPEQAVLQILDAGRLAGSAGNRQPWTFVIPEGRERIERLAEAVYVGDNVRGAALVVAVLVQGKGPTSFDAGRAAQNMLLAAWNAGIASCPNGVADVDAARAALDAGEGEVVSIVLTFGLPGRARDPGARGAEDWSDRANRRPLSDVVRRLP